MTSTACRPPTGTAFMVIADDLQCADPAALRGVASLPNAVRLSVERRQGGKGSEAGGDLVIGLLANHQG